MVKSNLILMFGYDILGIDYLEHQLQAKFLKNDDEGSKVIRKEARNALLELSKDDYYRILIIEEGLLPVPLIGAAAYKSFRPGLHSWPRLPDGTEIERTSKTPSRFGASELLLGLNVDDKIVNIDEVKMNAIVGRTQQQFLARIGAIETEDGKKESELSSGRQLTLLPWVDGVARLVLILELQDESALSRAAESIADASINEDTRIAFKEAGAVKHLVRLSEYNNHAVKLSAIRALERLSVRYAIIVPPRFNILLSYFVTFACRFISVIFISVNSGHNLTPAMAICPK